MTPKWRNHSQAIAAPGASVERRPKTPRLQTASPAVSHAKTRSRQLRRSGASALPSRSRFRARATSGRNLCTSIGWPQAHRREAVPRPLHAHLGLEDREDEHVPAPTVVAAGLAEHTLEIEAVPPERVDAQHVVGVDLRLHAMHFQRVHRVRQSQARRLDPPTLAERARVTERGLDEREALHQMNAVQTHEADGRRAPLGRLDEQRERRRVVQGARDEFGVVRAGVAAMVEEWATDHLIEQGLVRPLREEAKLVPGRRAEDDPAARGDGCQRGVVENSLGDLGQVRAARALQRQLIEKLGAEERAVDHGARKNRARDSPRASVPGGLQERRESDGVSVLDLLEVQLEARHVATERRLDSLAESRRRGAREHTLVFEPHGLLVAGHAWRAWLQVGNHPRGQLNYGWD